MKVFLALVLLFFLPFTATAHSYKNTTPPRQVDKAIHRHFGHGALAMKALRVTYCESAWNAHVTSNRLYRGLWQFSYRTWRGMGGKGDPARASAEEQTMRARRLWRQSGGTFTRHWPVCGWR